MTLWRFTEVESATRTSCGAAPTRRAILAPTRAGAPIQSASFQLRMSPEPHSWVTTVCRRATAACGSGPRELPSR